MTGFIRNELIRPTISSLRGGARGWGWYHRALKKIETKSQETSIKYDAAVPSPRLPRPRAYLDISIGESELRRIVIELATDVVPKTAKNFINLCTDSPLGSYKRTNIHNVTKGVYVVAGDILNGNGTGGHAALVEGDRFFPDENFALQFSERGVVGMANGGVDRNASQFFVTLKPLPHLNGRNVAFGKIIEGLDNLKALESVYCIRGRPLSKITIGDCGLLE